MSIEMTSKNIFTIQEIKEMQEKCINDGTDSNRYKGFQSVRVHADVCSNKLDRFIVTIKIIQFRH